MKISKFLAFLLIIPFLVSCNASDKFGTYAFQLGKKYGTHFGITLNLTNKARQIPSLAVNEGQNDIAEYQFSMVVDINMPQTPELNLEAFNKESEDKTNEPYAISMDGTYAILDGDRLMFYIEKFDGEALPEEFEVLISGALLYIINAKLYSNYVGITIPVSLNDLEKQIEWLQLDDDNFGKLPPDDSPYFYHTVTMTLLKK